MTNTPFSTLPTNQDSRHDDMIEIASGFCPREYWGDSRSCWTSDPHLTIPNDRNVIGGVVFTQIAIATDEHNNQFFSLKELFLIVTSAKEDDKDKRIHEAWNSGISFHIFPPKGIIVDEERSIVASRHVDLQDALLHGNPILFSAAQIRTIWSHYGFERKYDFYGVFNPSSYDDEIPAIHSIHLNNNH